VGKPKYFALFYSSEFKMSKIDKDSFFKHLMQRLRRYEKAIPVAGDGGMMRHIFSIINSHIAYIKKLDNTFNLFGEEFWGYGVNTITIDDQTFQNVDVYDVEKIQELNKHQKYNVFWLTIFKVKNEFLYFNIIGMDVCKSDIHSETNKRISLKDFRNAVVKTRNQKVYLELEFNSLDNPISFQVDNYADSLTIAQYYIDSLKKTIAGLSEPKKEETFKLETVPLQKESWFFRTERWIKNHKVLSVVLALVIVFTTITGVFTGIDYWRSKSEPAKTVNGSFAFTPEAVYYDIDNWGKDDECRIKIHVETNSDNFQILDSIKIDKIKVLVEYFLLDSQYQPPTFDIIDKLFTRKLLNSKNNSAEIELKIKHLIMFSGNELGRFEEDKKLKFAVLFIKIPFSINNECRSYTVEVPFILKR